MQHHGSMYHPTDGWKIIEPILDELSHLDGVRNVTTAYHHVRTGFLGFHDEFFDLSSRRATPGNEDKRPRSAADHPPTDTTTQSACTTNKDVGGIGSENLPGCAWGNSLVSAVSRVYQEHGISPARITYHHCIVWAGHHDDFSASSATL